MKALQMRVVMGVVVMAVLLVSALLAVSNTGRQSAEAQQTETQAFSGTVRAWCGTNVYNECFEPNCVAPTLSYGECEFYYLYELDLRKTREAQRTPTPQGS